MSIARRAIGSRAFGQGPEIAAGGGTNVSATSQALALTAYPATVAFDVSIAASSQALTITPNAATISFGTLISAGSQVLSLATYPAAIAFDVSVSAQAQALSLTTYAATVTTGVAPASIINFRRTLSALGTRAGERQLHKGD